MEKSLQDKLSKIVLTGAESTGKTTLAEQLALHYQTSWSGEYARVFLSKSKGAYGEEDLLTIAKKQQESRKTMQKKESRFLICDTGLLVLRVWSLYKYKRCHPWIADQWQRESNVLYLLCLPDIPWQPDPLRENPLDREVLTQMYRHELQSANKPFAEISGMESMRLKNAVRSIESLLLPKKM